MPCANVQISTLGVRTNIYNCGQEQIETRCGKCINTCFRLFQTLSMFGQVVRLVASLDGVKLSRIMQGQTLRGEVFDGS